ncbi:MAG: rubredoxin [Clostridia bacterium]|nr:rubredoxin [Clostridia bacterium]MBQ6529793.1 rubredoxin [Clostridia bacterium]
MEIKAVKFRKEGFYSQPFAFGGEEGMDKFNPQIRYRGSLQNYLIDTGDEVILVDTGLPGGTPEEVPDETSLAFTGKDICSYMDALSSLGYKPEQITKILLTHKHADHSGELKSFPNAKIYVNEEETGADELQGITNIEPVKFTDGAYYNFPQSQKIRDGIYFIKAKGHTNGNSIVIVENEGLFYMIHGDITYVDEALYENKLSVVYDDLKEARITLDRVREFIRNHPTVYMGTHTPQGYENLEAKRVMDLDNPVPTVPIDYEVFTKTATGKYVCSICGYVYDPAVGDPDNGIPAGTPFEELPEDWHCPRCKQGKDKFNKA